MAANQTAAAAGTTAVSRPVPVPIYNKMDDSQAYNNVIANIANKFDFKTSDMDPAEYNRLVGVFETMQDKYGRPKIYDTSKRSPEDPEERPYYDANENYLTLFSPKKQVANNAEMQEYAKNWYKFSNINPNLLKQYYQYYVSPDIYFQELAHSKQYTDDYYGSSSRRKFDNDNYEDNSDPLKGKYGVRGAFEHEAHSMIAPDLWNEFKDLYTKRYKKEFPQEYENRKISPEVDKITEKYQTNLLKNTIPKRLVVSQNTTNVAKKDNRNIIDYNKNNVSNKFFQGLNVLSMNPEISPSSKSDIEELQGELYELGYPMNNSWSSKNGGRWDGIYGPETKAALKDWQSKQKK